MSTPKLTERGRQTRQRIVAATGRRILQSGIGGTTLDDVRAETLTSKSQLFHYFPGGKAELIREVAVWEGQELLAAQRPEIDDLSTWESWARWRASLVDYYISQGRWACPIGSLAAQVAATDAETAQVIAAALRQWRDLLAAGIIRMQAAGDIDPAADPQRLAAAILAALQGGLLLSQPERDSWPLDAALDCVLDPLHSATAPS